MSFALALILLASYLNAVKYPVVLVPGLGGSRIDYQSGIGKSWEALWLDLVQTVPILDDTYLDQLRIVYNPADDQYNNNVYAAQPRDYGGVDGVDHTDDLFVFLTYYFHDIIDVLRDFGYVVGQTLFAAPFDFRRITYASAPTDGTFANLQALIETASNGNNLTVILVTHSEGAPLVRHFLANYVDDAWKAKYIRSWVAPNGQWGGSPVSLQYILGNEEWIIPTLDAEETHYAVSSYAGLFWTLPNPLVYTDNPVVVNINNNAVNVNNICTAIQLGENNQNVAACQTFTKYLSTEFVAPNVQIYLYNGVGVQTPYSGVYSGHSATDWYNYPPSQQTGDGDGVVPTVSLRAPLDQWGASQIAPISLVELKGVNHTAILGNPDFLKALMSIVGGGNGTFGARADFVGLPLKEAVDVEKDILKSTLAIEKKILLEEIRSAVIGVEADILENYKNIRKSAEKALGVVGDNAEFKTVLQFIRSQISELERSVSHNVHEVVYDLEADISAVIAGVEAEFDKIDVTDIDSIITFVETITDTKLTELRSFINKAEEVVEIIKNYQNEIQWTFEFIHSLIQKYL